MSQNVVNIVKPGSRLTAALVGLGILAIAAGCGGS